MSVNLFYQRPGFVSPKTPRTPSMMSEATEPDRNSQSPSPPGVPESLSFDRIISGGTCPPCTLRDFMDYLVYVHHTAEHLQFFMWFRGYVERFEALPASEKTLSPQWTRKDEMSALEEWKKVRAATQKQQLDGTVKEVFKGTMFGNEGPAPVTHSGVPYAGFGVGNPFVTPPATSHGRASQTTENSSVPSWETSGSIKSPTHKSLSTKYFQRKQETASSVARETFENEGLTQPFTIQPFRKEIEHVIQTYFAEQSPRELNISSGQRKTLLKALETTTHPSAFTSVIAEVENVLRNQLHPNFIRWAICNGNRPRVIFARGLGMSLILFGVLVELLITLSNARRGYRALGAIGLVLGVATLIAAAKGICVVLHGLHHRHLRPWELFTDAENGLDKEGSTGSYSMRESVETIQSANSYEDEPWVIRYRKRNIVRKIFDREVWIQEPALRQIQDMVFLQSVLIALAVALVITAIFVAVPKGGFM